MPPVRRRLFNALTLLSLLLFVAVCALWVRSYGRVESVGWDEAWDGEPPCVSYSVVQINGLLVIGRWRYERSVGDEAADPDPGGFWYGAATELVEHGDPVEARAFPLLFDYGTLPELGLTQALIPHWPVAAVFAVPPAVWLARAG